jgi:two-component system sensor histidine kinase QseC
MDRELSEIRAGDVRVELQDRYGFALAGSGPGGKIEKPPLGCHDQGLRRTCAVRAEMFTVVAAADRGKDREEHNRVLFSLLGVAAVAALLVGSGGQYVARRALSPLTRLTQRIADIEPGSGARLGQAHDFAELERLRSRFDDLMSRFDQALLRERRFTAHASHELRTPLGVARAEIEAILHTADVEFGVARAVAAIDRLSELVQALLWFARAEERLDQQRTAVVNVADLVREQAEQRGRGSSGTHITCGLPDELLVRGDEHLLRLATANVLDNAVKHGTGAQVDVSVEVLAGTCRLSVANQGTLPGEHERLFEAFQRAKAASDVSGFGLGLPLARSVIRAHGGEVVLEAPGQRHVRCVVTLPLLDWSEERSARSDSV